MLHLKTFWWEHLLWTSTTVWVHSSCRDLLWMVRNQWSVVVYTQLKTLFSMVATTTSVETKINPKDMKPLSIKIQSILPTTWKDWHSCKELTKISNPTTSVYPKQQPLSPTRQKITSLPTTPSTTDRLSLRKRSTLTTRYLIFSTTRSICRSSCWVRSTSVDFCINWSWGWKTSCQSKWMIIW